MKTSIKTRLSLLIFSLFIFSAALSASPVETYVFNDDVSEIRYQALVKELRCPKCQNQNLADSNSQIAVDLRQQVYEMVQDGKADSEVVNFMVERYGEFVLYRPRVNALTYVLWFGPALLLLVCVIVVVFVIRRKPVEKQQSTLSDEQKNQLDQILKDK